MVPIRAVFPCAVCGEDATTVELGSDGALRVDGTASVLTARRAGDRGLRQAILDGDAWALYRIRHEYAPCYCPDCGSSYCAKHWRLDERLKGDWWYDCTYGTCPHGHRRVIGG